VVVSKPYLYYGDLESHNPILRGVMNRLVVDGSDPSSGPKRHAASEFFGLLSVLPGLCQCEMEPDKPTHQTPNSGRNLHDPGMELATVHIMMIRKDDNIIITHGDNHNDLQCISHKYSY